MTTFHVNDDPPPLSDINPTPLIDVLLVLLIVLILALPPATHRTSLDLPGNRPGSPAIRPSIMVDIEFDGSLFWDGASVDSLATLEEYFRAIARQPHQPNVLLSANARVRYDVVAKVLAIAQRNGIRRLGFVGQERFLD